ncbi:methylated-DNA--[protein]-cysteine S-methyltransferase [uncultured Anaerococcus sp.]|uniref:methylated-DNA--[protein]-cysteine S-methyltransferase n=1 Tax=uncultured Anaerococcus sp. TaxID=293428 RepID=UPI0028062CF1|nr:methylated-DNA--[protein]-cysteine S-methyltransferase [uncultured Anaerococcus sp.]
MKYGFFESPLGIIKISYEEKIRKIELVDEIDENSEENGLFILFKNQLLEYFVGKRTGFDHLELLDPKGTAFQKSVWQALLKIPYGKTRSYKEIAKAIGKPGATQSLGTAIGKNPILIIVPCHRVIRADGTLGGFAFGSQIKRRLLEIEGINFPS